MAKILIVDDSEVAREELCIALKKGPFELLLAVNGEEGLKTFLATPDIDLIITDVHMPIMDGITMCEKIVKESGRTPPVFAMTTERDPAIKAKGKEFGVKCWIVKPANAQAVFDTVTAFLKPKAGAK